MGKLGSREDRIRREGAAALRAEDYDAGRDLMQPSREPSYGRREAPTMEPIQQRTRREAAATARMGMASLLQRVARTDGTASRTAGSATDSQPASQRSRRVDVLKGLLWRPRPSPVVLLASLEGLAECVHEDRVTLAFHR